MFAASKVGGAVRGLKLSTGVAVLMAPLHRGGLVGKGGISLRGWGQVWGRVPLRSRK